MRGVVLADGAEDGLASLSGADGDEGGYDRDFNDAFVAVSDDRLNRKEVDALVAKTGNSRLVGADGKDKQKGTGKGDQLVALDGHDLNQAWSGATHALLLHGDGQWRAGPVAEVMRADLLGACLGHPIAAIAHGGRTIFLPDAAPGEVASLPARRTQ